MKNKELIDDLMKYPLNAKIRLVDSSLDDVSILSIYAAAKRTKKGKTKTTIYIDVGSECQ